jgi:HEAT repeat protein
MKNQALVLSLAISLFTYGCVEQQQGGSETKAPAKKKAPVATDNKFYQLKNRAIKIVRAGLADENSYVRNRAIEVTVTAGRVELMQIVSDLLRDDEIAVRYAAGLAVGDMSYPGGIIAATRALRDESVSVQMAAAYALTKLGRHKYSDILCKSAFSKDQSVRAKAVVLLGRLGDKKYLELLHKVMRDKTSSDIVKIQAAEAIANLGDETILQSKLWPLLISKHADDKVIGIGAMAALGTPDARNAILTMLMDDIGEIRLFAAGQLGRLGDTSGQEIVLKYLLSPQFDVNQWSVANESAVAAVGEIGTDEMKKFLPKLLDSRNKLIQLSAAQAVLSGGASH